MRAEGELPLGSFAGTSLAELVFVIRSPAQLTEKGELAVYKPTFFLLAWVSYAGNCENHQDSLNFSAFRSRGTSSAHKYAFINRVFTKCDGWYRKCAKYSRTGSVMFSVNVCTYKALSGKLHYFATHCSLCMKCWPWIKISKITINIFLRSRLLVGSIFSRLRESGFQILLPTTAGLLVRSACPWRHIRFLCKLILVAGLACSKMKRERSFIYKELLILRNLARKQFFFLVEMFFEIPSKELSMKYVRKFRKF